MESSKVDVNRSVENRTAIHIAAWSHDLVSIRNLLARGADVKSTMKGRYPWFHGGLDDHGPSLLSTPFQTFLQFSKDYPVPIKPSPEDSFEILKIFVDAGCNLNEKDRGGHTAFHKILNGCQGVPAKLSQDIIQYMFSNGADSSILTNDGSTALHLMPCHLESAIESLVAGGTNVNSRRKSDGRTPLFNAVGSQKYTSMFIKLGADCNIQDLKGNTPLHVAAQGLGYSTNVEVNAVIKTLLAAGADPEIKNKDGLAPIHTIRNCKDHKDALLILLAAGAGLESRTAAGCTVLLSCLKDHTCYDRDLKTLLDIGANVHARDFVGKTVLHYCCERDKGLDLLPTLVDAGADPFECDYAGNTLFHQAAGQAPSYHEKEQLAFLEKLLELGVDPRAINHAGQTPVHIPVGNRATLEFLLGPKCNVDINSPDHLGIRVIHLAASIGESQVKLLIDKGADATIVTLEGQTPLHIAARSRQCNAVGLITDFYLQEGKKDLVDKTDEEGRTALHYAVCSGSFESVAILVNIGGADLNAKDGKGLTPLHMCAHIIQEHRHWIPELIFDQRKAYIVAAGVSSKDPYIKEGDSPPNTRDIIRFLISHGADITRMNSANRRNRGKGLRCRTIYLDYAISRDFEVLVDELLDLEKIELLSEPQSKPDSNEEEDEDEMHDWIFPVFPQDLRRDEFLEKYSSSGFQNVDFLEGLVVSGQNNLGIFQSLLSKNHWKGILKMKALGADMLRPNSSGESCVTLLIKGGHATLLKDFSEDIKRMDEEWIKEMEKTDVNLSGRLRLPIFIAFQRNLPNLEVLKVLIEKIGVDVNVQLAKSRFSHHEEGRTALHIVASCAEWWHLHALKNLLENGANPNIQDKDGNTPLHIAVTSSNDSAVSRLLSHGANPSLLNNAWLSPLTASKPSSSSITLLVSHGADVSAGARPFIFNCIEEGNLPVIRQLISLGLDLNARLPPAKEPPLPADDDFDDVFANIRARMRYENLEAAENSFPIHFAAGRKFNTGERRGATIPIIESLLKGGANPLLAFNDEGDSIIADICVRGGILAPFLQQLDLDLEVRDSKGRTLLLCACTTDGNWDGGDIGSSPSDVSLLIEHGADITAVDNEGRNVLYHLLTSSAKGKRIQAHHPSDLNNILAHPLASQLVAQKDKNGTASLQHALKMGQFEAVDALLAKGADPMEADGEGNTALHHLAAQANEDDFLDFTYVSRLAGDQLGQYVEFMGPDYSKPSLITALFTRFVDLGVDINARNKAGETCLFGFVCMKGIEVFNLKFFEELGSDFAVVNTKGEGLLHACAKGGEPSGSNYSRRSSIGITAVLRHIDEERAHKAASGKAGVFKWLIEVKSLDPLAEDIESKSALDVATASGCSSILDLFRRKED